MSATSTIQNSVDKLCTYEKTLTQNSENLDTQIKAETNIARSNLPSYPLTAFPALIRRKVYRRHQECIKNTLKIIEDLRISLPSVSDLHKISELIKSAEKAIDDADKKMDSEIVVLQLWMKKIEERQKGPCEISQGFPQNPPVDYLELMKRRLWKKWSSFSRKLATKILCVNVPEHIIVMLLLKMHACIY